MASTAANFTAHLNLPGDPPHPTPATLVRPGDTVVLQWSGPAGQHTLYSEDEPSGRLITFPYVTQPLARDCVFTLKTVASGMKRYDSLTVTVDRPVLPGVEIGELVSGPDLTITAPLTANGHLTVDGETDVSGTCTATAVVASGPVETKALTVTATTTGVDSGSLLSTDDELTVTGTLQSDESLSIQGGPVEIFDKNIRSGTEISPYNPAPSDGFIVTTSDPDSGTYPSDVQLSAGNYHTSAAARDYARGTALAALPVHQGEQLSSTASDAHYYLIRFSTGS
ncbi:hypothetical protein [Streptomyces noursei]|uniref:hypothetical protein n=1 Tax=Streptomyces noursei TaxID=1971 RepID=UPI001965B1E0|nr:hypothetical protein [Streptomyces noursei]QRX89940.1 hypothetical protein JNO44_02865 [Streptomyces noursei]